MYQNAFKPTNPQQLLAQQEEGIKEKGNDQKTVIICSGEGSTRRNGTNRLQMFIGLLQMIEKNDRMIRELSNFTEENYQKLEKYSTSQRLPKLQNDYLKLQQLEEVQQPNLLLSKLFGSKSYKYSLQLSRNFPETLYKQRNFQISLRLVDSNKELIRNNNIINLCLSLCTTEGNWVSSNKVGQSILKGKTEVELFKGEANFTKIYIRDISRHYVGKKLNLVVYCKQSALIYRENNSMETYVDWELAKPLIIQGINVKAKKKE